MPIRDREKRRLPKLGVIRLGRMETRKRSDGSEYSFPVQTDHFVLRDAPRLAEYFARRSIDKPRELDVILPFPTLEDNYDASYAVWANGVLLCRGDGERVLYANPMRVTQDQKGTHVYNEAGPTLIADGVAQCKFCWGEVEFVPGQVVPCPGSNAEGGHPHCAACRMSAILKVTPYDDEVFEFGYLQLTTGSWRNHQTIMGTLESLPPGALAGHLPFTLRMVEESTIYQDKDGKRKSTTRWFLQLMPHPDKLKALFMRETQHYIEGMVEPPALPPTVDYVAEPTSPPPYAEREAWERMMDDGAQADDAEWEPIGPEEEPEEEPPEEAGDPDEQPGEPQPPEGPDDWPTEPPPDLPPEKPKEPQTKPPAAPPKRGPGSRPPDLLRQQLREAADRRRHQGEASNGQVGLIWVLCGQMWEDPKQHMGRLLEFLFGKHAPEKLSGKQAATLIDWLRDPSSEKGHAIIDRRAVAEARQVVILMLKREGQQMLPGLERE